MAEREKNLPKSGKEFGQLKNRQEQNLDAIVEEFRSQVEDPSSLEKYKQMFIKYDLDGKNLFDFLL